jgi:hypothetical protein
MIISFPFTDLSSTKLRPAIILGEIESLPSQFLKNRNKNFILFLIFK